MSQSSSSLQFSKFVDSTDIAMPLNEALTELVRYIETSLKSSTPIFATVLLLDERGERLYRGAAPSLPSAYNDAIDGIKVGPSVGSCGTAVFAGHSIFVVDIEHDALWADFKDLALSHGLRACWSVPILDENKQVLGTFALYYDSIRNPSLKDRQFIDECASAAARLIKKNQNRAGSAR